MVVTGFQLQHAGCALPREPVDRPHLSTGPGPATAPQGMAGRAAHAMTRRPSGSEDASPGYAELGDLLGEMVRRSAVRPVCAFCRTARNGGGRCDVCGARPGPAGDPRDDVGPDSWPQASAQPPAAAVLIRLLGTLLLPPLLLSVGFGIWLAVHRSQSAAPRSVTAPPGSAWAAPRAVPMGIRANLTLDGANRAAASPIALFPTETGFGAQGATVASGMTAGPAATAAAQVATAQRTLPQGYRLGSPVRKPNQRLAVAAASLNACAVRSIFLRAVCINNVCSQAEQRHRPHCAQAVAQRQIDERRRDFALLN